MAFSEASMSLGSQQDPLGLFSEEDQMLPEPNQELLSIEDVPLGQAVAEPAQNSAPNPQDTPVAASRTKGRRASAVSSPLHILIPEDAIGGMETLFADPSLGDGDMLQHLGTGVPQSTCSLHVRSLCVSAIQCSGSNSRVTVR